MYYFISRGSLVFFVDNGNKDMPKEVLWTGVDYPNSSIAQFNMSGTKFR
jgi:hypothetical protein